MASSDVNIVLVPYRRDYLEFFVALRNDMVTKQYNPVDDLSLEALHDRCSAAASDFAHFDEAEGFLLFIKSEQRLIGDITLRNINRRMQTAEVGYSITPEARGKGYATAALGLVTRRAFNESPLRKL